MDTTTALVVSGVSSCFVLLVGLVFKWLREELRRMNDTINQVFRKIDAVGERSVTRDQCQATHTAIQQVVDSALAPFRSFLTNGIREDVTRLRERVATLEAEVKGCVESSEQQK